MSLREGTSQVRRLWAFVQPDGWAFGLALAAGPIIAVLNLAQPWLLREAIDGHIAVGVPEGLGRIALEFLGVVVLAYVLEAAYTLAIAWAGQRTILRLRLALYRHVTGLAARFFDRRPAGVLLSRLTSDVESLGEALGAGVVTIVLDVLMVLGVLVAMFWMEPRLTAVLLVLAPVLIGLLELIRRQMRVLFLQIRDIQAAVTAFLAERVDGVEVVQLYSHEELASRTFEGLNRRFRDANSRSNWFESGMFSLVDGFSSVCVALILWYGAGLAVDLGFEVPLGAAISPGLLVAFIDYLDRLFRPLRDASNKITILQRASAALVKIFELLDERDRIPSGERPLPVVRGYLSLRDVRFRYREGARPVLDGLDLELGPGEVVALVGATGSGKTTLTRLINRSYDGYEGSITLDGHELRDYRLSDLRRRVAAVRQDIQLFSETVEFNVSLGDPAIGRADCEAAAALVHADTCIERVGWDHVLRDRGANVSVGEGQLLTFARTMAHAPDLIILDEATASVDPLTEALIQDAIARILEQKTVLVIAHRLSTVQRADRIAVMEGGRIVEMGTHAELVARGGRYAALVAAGSQALVGSPTRIAQPNPQLLP